MILRPVLSFGGWSNGFTIIQINVDGSETADENILVGREYRATMEEEIIT